ncbi:hypothetical protein JTE90_001375 [Oedothorax gibbosus]|uniref:Secreted protein n=1 Tax=Oedothorax gibbosus TaxID=931172 RepID=A0AAV6VIB2_9ARAC|nr:hypothetical protein JTE90_001375 [Oedothorax gibbosus]
MKYYDPVFLLMMLMSAIILNCPTTTAGFLRRRQESQHKEIMAAGLVAKMLQENDHRVVHVHHIPVFIPVFHHR